MTEEQVAELAANLNAVLQAGLEDESFGCLACGEAPCICLDDIEE
jgi:hypothetical protein